MPISDCYQTTRFNGSHRHEVLYGTKNRQKSIKDGLIVFLTPDMHNMSKNGVHFNYAFDLYLKRIAQETWQRYYNKSKEDFISRYGRNYIE